MNINSAGFVNIQGWMRTELNLAGNDLLVYAIIFGFSQDEETKFEGSLQYLADWCGCTKQGIQKNLKNLLDKELITKEEYTKNGVKYCAYKCSGVYNLVAYHTTELHTIQQSCTNNINNINTDTKDKVKLKDKIKNNNVEQEEFDYNFNPKPVAKKNLYKKCLDSIDEFTDLPEIHNALVQYLDFRINIKDKPLYGINQWNGMLKALDKAVETCGKDYVDVINYTLQKGWLSFYPIPSYQPKPYIPDTNTSEQHHTDENSSTIAKNEDGSLMTF